MARPERFELPTLCFEGRCSIQLSYGRAGGFCDLITELAGWDFDSKIAFSSPRPILCLAPFPWLSRIALTRQPSRCLSRVAIACTDVVHGQVYEAIRESDE